MSDVTVEHIPDDVEELKSLVRSLRDENSVLKENITLLKSKLFAQKSEKLHPEEEKQIRMFNEAEVAVDDSPQKESDREPVGDSVTIPEHTRKKPARRTLPDNLPRKEILHDISAEEKICGCGAHLVRIGEEVCEKLDIIPQKYQVLRHVRPKYACKNCEGEKSNGPAVKIAPAPKEIIPKGMVSPGFLAYTLTAKFTDAIPFHRMEKIFSRWGIDLSRSTMCGWFLKIYELYGESMLSLLRKEVLSGPLVALDETTLQVLKEKEKKDTTKSYMWVEYGGTPERPTILFEYRPTRRAAFLDEFLKPYNGFLVTDGYAGYNSIGTRGGIIHVGCWAHVRREFFDLKKSQKKGKIASDMLGLIGKLYAVEAEAREKKLSPEETLQLRQNQSMAIVDEIKQYLDENSTKVPPKSLAGKAIHYTLKQWPKLIVFLTDGRVPIDNNTVENAIRPFVVGRKNWLFAGSPRGADASAFLYTLVENAKMNHLEPYHYLRFLFENLPVATSTEEMQRLLPQYVDRDLVNAISA